MIGLLFLSFFQEGLVLKTYKGKKTNILLLLFISFFVITCLAIGIFNKYKSLPEGISYEGDIHHIDHIEFLSDLTYKNDLNKTIHEQEIFDEAFTMIEDAEEFIVVDMFLFNSYTDQDKEFPDLSGELTKKLIKQKTKHPDMPIVFITDPINTGYHSYIDEHIKRLEENNIEVVITNLNRLRDSNKAYTSAWRLLFQQFGQSGTGWLPNPFAKEAPKFTLRSYLELFNVKANHRKAIITEEYALVASANPHNESGFASNIGFKLSGNIIGDMVKAEQAVINYSNGKTTIPIPKKQPQKKTDIAAQYLTEGKILKHVVKELNESQKEDTVWIAMFYIANRDVINALHDATERGVKVNLILDPNKNAFGSQKAGLPNVPVAAELIKNELINIRWFQTEEEQFHTKLLYINKGDNSVIIGGSANFTTRNLDDLNLENNIKVMAPSKDQIIQDTDKYFQRIWNNKDGNFTTSYETNEDALTPILRLTYWVQKLSGLTTY